MPPNQSSLSSYFKEREAPKTAHAEEPDVQSCARDVDMAEPHATGPATDDATQQLKLLDPPEPTRGRKPHAARPATPETTEGSSQEPMPSTANDAGSLATSPPKQPPKQSPEPSPKPSPRQSPQRGAQAGRHGSATVYARAPGQPMCRFGTRCYRKNPSHFVEADHPDDHPFFVQAAASSGAGTTRKRGAGDVEQDKDGDKDTHKHTLTDVHTDARTETRAQATESTDAPSAHRRKLTHSQSRPRAASSTSNAENTHEAAANSTATDGHANPTTRAAAAAAPPTPTLPTYDRDRPAWQERLSSALLVSCPEEVLALYELALTLSNSNPCAAFASAGVHLIGPFQLLAGTHNSNVPLALTSRGVHDPPEFLPLFSVRNVGNAGYWRDDPSETEPVAVMRTQLAAAPGVAFAPLHDSAVGALYSLLNAEAAKGSLMAAEASRLSTRVAKLAEEIKISLEYDVAAAKKARKKAAVAPTSCGMGIVVPYNRRTAIGYRKLHLMGDELRKLLTRIRNSSGGERVQHQAELDELINWANIANDESDFGASLQLGRDLLNHDAAFATQAKQMLVTAYTLLGRTAFADIARQHAAQRRHG